MRLLVLSDLHREIWKDLGPKIDLTVSRPDVVILAGDIDTGARAVGWAAQTFTGLPVVYVHGNHEAYGHRLEEMQRDIATACAATSNVHFLNCGEFRHGNVRFLGATLWTDFDLFGDDARLKCMREAEATMNDYQCIRLSEAGNRKLRPSDTIDFHIQQKSWLSKMLKEVHNGPTVVITHMAPSFGSIANRFADDDVSAAFASRLDGMVSQADVWIHGHMHDSFDYVVEGCRVVCNPLGYQKRSGNAENPEFDPAFVVEI
jgi:predicted phosphodiesterase